MATTTNENGIVKGETPLMESPVNVPGTIKINNLVFMDVPRVHIPVQIMPGQKYATSQKVVEYKCLPGVVELWRFNTDGWDIFDKVI